MGNSLYKIHTENDNNLKNNSINNIIFNEFEQNETNWLIFIENDNMLTKKALNLSSKLDKDQFNLLLTYMLKIISINETKLSYNKIIYNIMNEKYFEKFEN